MNPIEEMMKAAEVDTTIQKINVVTKRWEVVGHKLPDFTPEKQLEVIKLIADLPYKFPDYALRIGNVDNNHCLEREFPTIPEHDRNCYVCTGKNENFSHALAQLTKELIEVGRLNKQQIKEILEG